uniref:SRPBCC family protein n=1 Tax=Roseovarius indicus TaxID=540747 RepID=UPI003B5240C5
MTATEKDLTLTVERVIDASPETLFDAWLDPETMKRFICPGDTTVPSATSDAHEGGRFLGEDQRDGHRKGWTSILEKLAGVA